MDSEMKTDPAIRKSRIPHWNWLLAGTIVLVLMIAAGYGIQISRQQRFLSDLKKRHCQVKVRIPKWWPNFIGDRYFPASLSPWVAINGEFMSLSDGDFRRLSGMSNLQELRIRAAQNTDVGLVHVAKMNGLVLLWLDGSQVTDSGLTHLAGLETLQSLHLGGTKITDVGLNHLTGLTNLISLYLDNTQITGAGLAQI